ncbi:MAG: protein translocase subunit SecF [Patescibacteria group bacterium]
MLRIYTTMFWFSVTLTLAAVLALFVFGLNLGVDFLGGSVIEVGFSGNRPALNDIRDILTGAGLADVVVNYTGDGGALIRTGELSENEHQNILAVLKNGFSGLEEKRFDSIGPVIGNELKNKSITAILLVLSAVIIYIALVFRKLSKTLSPWVMGFAAILALLHDVVVPLGVFAVLGNVYGVEISAVFVAAALTILGYSVADTVVVFDRIRENIIRGLGGSLSEIAHKSVLQTLTRSLNTTFTTLLPLFAIYFFGGESIRYFALALIMGIFLGAYSSIFIASPLLVWLSRKK